ncbi:MAG: RNA degradosome polyphosphate kinase [Sporichthyaceae bacterium]|nr:RNA degradosome polyphosphate kinase [Sporichthyaceae bacterium]
MPGHLSESTAHFIDREESWLAWNQRVLELAETSELPLLERVRFLAIFATNLDEFFMVRVAGLKRRLATGVGTVGLGSQALRPQLERISKLAHRLALRHSRAFRRDIRGTLAAEGIEMVRWVDLSAAEQSRMHTFFRTRIYPVLTPLAVDPAHPFPYISGLSLNLAVLVRDPTTGRQVFARVKVPPSLPRFVETSRHRFVPLDDVIAAHLDQLFAGMEIVERHAFRVTRNEDLDVDDDDTESLLAALERELLRRRFGPAVRIEVEDSISPEVLSRLVAELGVEDTDIYRVPGPLDLSGLHGIADLDRSDLKFPLFVPAEVLPADTPVASVLDRRDVLVHHPYDSFATTVERFVEEAAADPQVLAIKQTLYRTSGDSPIVDALIDAAEAGKQVLVLVELKARFDERANIRWARKLEEAGVHVVYGVVGLKTHCKLSLVIRAEPDGTLRRYGHIGTGNYNPKTARQYEDFGLLTASFEVGEDLTDLFNQLSGFGRHRAYQRLLVGPHSLRAGLLERIEQEARNHEQGLPAGIQFKVNSLVDESIIEALYKASTAGVPIDIWVRSICSLRPGVPGMSDTIRVRSILGRFLEHSRIFVFENAGAPEVWLGSADLMHRNLDRRVEVLVRVEDPAQVDQLREFIQLAMSGSTASWRLGADGRWTRRRRGGRGAPLLDLQDYLVETRRWRLADG